MRNAELAYRTLDYIDAHPDEWDQTGWVCGTKACFAGWAVFLSGGRVSGTSWDPRVADVYPNSPAKAYEGWSVDEAAQYLLGVEDIDGGLYLVDQGVAWLFDGEHTRETLGKCVEQIFGPRPNSPELESV